MFTRSRGEVVYIGPIDKGPQSCPKVGWTSQSVRIGLGQIGLELAGGYRAYFIKPPTRFDVIRYNKSNSCIFLVDAIML